MKYLIKVDYSCKRVKTGGLWLVLDADSEPVLGVINTRPLTGGLLPDHDCKRYHDSQLCDEDFTCYW